MPETATLERPCVQPQSRNYGMVEFRAMASPCRIVTDDMALACAGEAIVHDLEAAWSRFLPTSEVSRLNRTGGAPCIVSPETFRLIELAERARVRTRGVFNPLMLERLEQLRQASMVERFDAASTEPIELIPSIRSVRLPAGSRFDPGGIGKGLAGDIVVERLAALGASTVQVELGGDVRLHGPNWTGGEWTVGVQDPRERTRYIGHVTLRAGAVATSSVVASTWPAPAGRFHHLIDPATGWPGMTDLAAVTATSSELWWAEIVAKTALLAGSTDAPAVLRRFEASGMLVGRDGTVCTVSNGGPL